MTDTAYEIIRDFQTAVVGAIGFAGVILTLFANSRLARKQRHFEQTERRQVVEAGLYEELSAFLEIVEQNIQHPGPSSGGTANIPHVRPLVSERLIQDLGLLERRKAQAALKGTMTVQDLNRRLALLAQYVTDDYFTYDEQGYKLVKAAYNGALQNLTEAVAALEPMENAESRNGWKDTCLSALRIKK